MTQQEEDKYIFEEIKPAGQLTKEDEVKEKKPIEGFYASLFDELKEKCDPTCFLKPYDKVKVDIANDIYYEILRNEGNEEKLKSLRLRAIKELGVKFATAIIYENLMEVCNPENFTGIKYDREKLNSANNFFYQIKENADDILALEKIQDDASELINEVQIHRENKNVENLKQNELNILTYKRKGFVLDKEELTISLIIIILVVSVLTYGMVHNINKTLGGVLLICIIVGGLFLLYQMRQHIDKKINEVNEKIKLLVQQKKIES